MNICISNSTLYHFKNGHDVIAYVSRTEMLVLLLVNATPSYNYMEKADFLYFEVEAPNGINLIMFRDSIA